MYFKLLALLEAIRIYGKDAHYGVRGTYSIAIHEYMDDIVGPITDWADEIKESIIMARGVPVPRGTAINAAASEYVPESLPYDDNDTILRNLLAVIEMAVREIETSAKTDPDYNQGTGDLLGRISISLAKHVGLIKMMLREIKDKADD